ANEMLAPSPDDGRLVNVTHIIPRSREDLERRRRAVELTASATAGLMGRTPDYLNVTFACFAGRSDVWARRGNEQGAANIVAYQKLMRDRDLSTTHSIMNPQVDRTSPRPSRRRARWRCTRSPTPRPGSSCAARGCWPRS